MRADRQLSRGCVLLFSGLGAMNITLLELPDIQGGSRWGRLSRLFLTRYVCIDLMDSQHGGIGCMATPAILEPPLQLVLVRQHALCEDKGLRDRKSDKWQLLDSFINWGGGPCQ